MSYQWYFNSTTALANKTNATLSFIITGTNEAGPYRIVVTNKFGSATSEVATLTVIVPPTILSSPTNQNCIAGSSVTLSAQAAGTAPLALICDS